MRPIFATLLALFPLAASAQDVVDCDWQARADNIAEPWSENAALFSNGAVRIAKLDTIEPAMGGFHLLVLSPPHDELGFRQCKVITWEETLGFAALDFPALEAAYDPAVGLMFTIPARVATGEGTTAALLRFSLNQATGAITPRLDLRTE
ncbi:hypothetical protein [Maritimibacter sp. DP1N21-5]|uniref:hypothetical protein n=1 Tax=Maritimibacter sp. DP1N21-5 TaxID=2836867 RepID=UPI001C497B3E|nr:hypothetical protein [Maritimibacter sp. DP1N21-5]MBV7408452.1 hypothetical protein [Maritimibacter sp. DP1N21-5]